MARPGEAAAAASLVLDWSTSYQASASASAGIYEEDSIEEEEDSESDAVLVRGRPATPATPTLIPSAPLRAPGKRTHAATGSTTSQSSAGHVKAHSGTLARRPRSLLRSRTAAASRSRSPKPPTPVSLPADIPRHPSPVALFKATTSSVKAQPTPKPTLLHVAVLPTAFRLHFNMPCTRLAFDVVIDARSAGEAALLIFAVTFAASRFCKTGEELWVPLELTSIVVLSLLYVFASHILSMLSAPTNNPQSVPPIQVSRRATTTEGSMRERRLSVQSLPHQVKSSGSAMLWMTEPKNYRECSDDGVLSASLFGPLIAVACLYSTVERLKSSPTSPLPDAWRIELPAVLPPRADGSPPPSALVSLLYARRTLLQISTLCSAIVLVHTSASRWDDWKRSTTPPEDAQVQRLQIPRHEGRRTYLYSKFTIIVSLCAVVLKLAFMQLGVPVWKDLSVLDVSISSLFHQFALYVMVRLARRGFTLGELGMVGHIATVMFMMTYNLTVARIWPITTPYIKTFVLPTPLSIFQVALIPGTFLTGFLLSPLLVLSRHIAQRPVRRLRFPEERKIHRRALAGGFYAGAALIVGGLLGMWTRWQLRGRDPWLWALFWLLEGQRPWSRPVLLAYWALLGSVSVAAWNRQLARNGRYRHLHNQTESAPAAAPGELSAEPPPAPAGGGGPADKAVAAASEFLDAADKHVPTLGLNARRKFFHALAVVMFVPGIAFDPAFTHLSFSAAFSLFTFAEYVRYFALYPFGAAVHVFLNEFLDHKDSGTAILSHFYLLTGCAVTLWLEGSSRILEFSGVLALGVGDAMASIVGKRLGRRRWSAASGKTVEGTAAFVLSVVGCALALRAFGLVEKFSVWKYTCVGAAGGLLEALSVQNDNLTLPLYMWALGTVWLGRT